MRQLVRLPLSDRGEKSLARRQTAVDEAHDSKAKADTLWAYNPVVGMVEARSVLEQMASGRVRCMYCEDSYGTDLDHFRPKSLYPEVAFVWTNLLLACSKCNAQAKAGNFPVDGQGGPMVVDPTAEDPKTHLLLLVRLGKYRGRTVRGSATITCFDLNRGELEEGRRQQWVALRSQLRDYDARTTEGNQQEADEIADSVRQVSFSAVLEAVIRIGATPAAADLLGEDVARILEDRPEISGWV